LLVKKLVALGALAAIALFDAQPGLPQPIEELNALKQEIQSLKEGQAAIQKDLQEIKNLLRARPAAAPAEPQNVVLNVADAPFKGEKTATLTLIDFSDYQ
jgi:type II secretory pathway component PulM